MKKCIAPFVLLMLAISIHAQTLPIKLYEVTRVDVSNGFTTNILGKELNTFQIPPNANSVKLSVQIPVTNYKKYIVNGMLRMLVVNTATQETILSTYWTTLYTDSLLVSACYFPVGEYKISLIDNTNGSAEYAKRIISVKGGSGIKTTASIIKFNGYDYDVNKFKIYTCKSVDEVNWKPIESTSVIKVGSCLTFFFDSDEKIKNPGTMRWKLYRVDADGKETFVNQKDQNNLREEWRRMYYEECDEFRVKGNYRMYIAVRNESEAYYGVRDKDYFAKTDFKVE